MTREEQLACLMDRPCSVCRYHKDDIGCNRWTCIFEEEPTESFKVGDIVKMKDSDPVIDDCDYGLVTRVTKREIYVMRKDGSCCDEPPEDFELISHSDNSADMINTLLHIIKARATKTYD